MFLADVVPLYFSQFSQFKLTLNIIESFLAGLRLKFLRLDGDTKQLDRQRGELR